MAPRNQFWTSQKLSAPQAGGKLLIYFDFMIFWSFPAKNKGNTSSCQKKLDTILVGQFDITYQKTKFLWKTRIRNVSSSLVMVMWFRIFVFPPKSVIFWNFQKSISLSLFGVEQSFWYLGLCTARDLFISGVFRSVGGLFRYPMVRHRYTKTRFFEITLEKSY